MMELCDYQAIAFEWHCGQDSALYQFAMNGQPTLATYDETIECITHLKSIDPQRERLEKLADYLSNHIFHWEGE